MKFISLLFFLCLISSTVLSQSVSVSALPGHAQNNTNTFPTKNNTLSISGGQFLFAGQQVFDPAAWSIAGQKGKLSFLMRRDALVLNSYDDEGKKLVEKELDFFDPADETLKVYQFDDGRTVVRDNVANFSFFDAKGNPVYSISNSSQSADGEQESQLASDKAGKTVILYNPAIIYGSDTGSRARVVFGENSFETIFNDMEQAITYLNVSDDGAYISMIVASGNNQKVLIFDRFGNEIYTLTPEENLRGIALSADVQFLTTYTSGRMQVYDITTGERIGSASSQSSLLYAVFQPEDEMILAVGGSISNNLISNPSVTAVHISKRQIAREVVDLQLSTLDRDSISIERTGAGQYKVKGLNRELEIHTRF